MAARKNVYEKQAVMSIVLAVVGGVCTLAGAVFIISAFKPADFQVVYDPSSMRMPAIAGALFVGVAGGGFGFLLGLLSAGQKTNKKNKLSWIGFFASAGVITLALCCGVFFFLTRYAPEVKEMTSAGG